MCVLQGNRYEHSIYRHVTSFPLLDHNIKKKNCDDTKFEVIMITIVTMKLGRENNMYNGIGKIS